MCSLTLFQNTDKLALLLPLHLSVLLTNRPRVKGTQTSDCHFSLVRVATNECNLVLNCLEQKKQTGSDKSTFLDMLLICVVKAARDNQSSGEISHFRVMESHLEVFLPLSFLHFSVRVKRCLLSRSGNNSFQRTDEHNYYHYQHMQTALLHQKTIFPIKTVFKTTACSSTFSALILKENPQNSWERFCKTHYE